MAIIDPAAQLVALARAHGLSPAPQREALDESGADFVVLHAVDARGAPWIVRAPRRADVMARAETERRALELVRARLPVAVPDWRIVTPELIAYPRLDGQPAAVVDPGAGGYRWRFDEGAPPAAFLETLAVALAALHAVAPAAAAAAGLPARTPAEVRTAFVQRMARSRQLLDIPDSVWHRWQAWIDDDGCWPDRSVLVHGDLHPAHLLIDDAHRVTGLLDWSEAHVGDPATDFAIVFATLGYDALDALLARYRDAGGVVWPRMRHHVVETWAAYPVVVAEFALLTGDAGPRQLGQALVDATAREIAGE